MQNFSAINHLATERGQASAALESSQRMNDEGRFVDALSTIESIRMELLPMVGVGTWEALMLLQEARSRYHLGDDATASSCLNQVNERARVQSAAVDAHWLSINGFIARRRSQLFRKLGNLASAVREAESALLAFNQAAIVAEMVPDIAFALQNKTNFIYTLGLKAAITGTSLHTNRELVSRAIVIEAETQEQTPPSKYCGLAGLTIIIDLAIGANMTPHQVIAMADDLSLKDHQIGYAAATRSVVSHRYTHWLDLLLDEISKNLPTPSAEYLPRQISKVQPRHLVRALTLAGKLAESQGSCRGLAAAVRSILTQLQLIERYQFALSTSDEACMALMRNRMLDLAGPGMRRARLLR